MIGNYYAKCKRAYGDVHASLHAKGDHMVILGRVGDGGASSRAFIDCPVRNGQPDPPIESYRSKRRPGLTAAEMSDVTDCLIQWWSHFGKKAVAVCGAALEMHGVKQHDFVYHATNSNYLASILRQGLIPHAGDIGHNATGVYVTTAAKDALGWAPSEATGAEHIKVKGLSSEGGRPIVLVLDRKQIRTLRKDTHASAEYGLYSPSTVKPKAIVDVLDARLKPIPHWRESSGL